MKGLAGENSSDFDKWLKRPLNDNEGMSNASYNANSKSSVIDDDTNKWLLVSNVDVSNSMDVDEDEDDDDGLAQWLLVERSERQKTPALTSSRPSSSSIEEWLLAAAADREPSIVVIDEDDDDDEDDANSGFSGDFANFC